MADLDAAGVLDVGGDTPVTVPRRAQAGHFGKSALFGLVLDQRAILADPPAKWPIAAKVLPGAPLVALGVANRAYVLESGQISLHGDVATLKGTAEVRRFYLGL